MAHKIFIAFLLLIGVSAAIAIGAAGFDYYKTPRKERVFRPDYNEMKPSSGYSHGLGIAGATMVIIGVTTYSSRKRIRALWSVGKLSAWLEFHIFLCLVGPVLVIYHTTFKAGGIAGICLWTMLSVAASGIIGRFLYTLIPRNIRGNELDSHQINEEFDRIGNALRETDIGSSLIKMVDSQFTSIKRPTTLREMAATLVRLVKMKQRVKHTTKKLLVSQRIPHKTARILTEAISQRASLIQRSIILLQVEKLFFYWHAIHLPFTAMMFITLVMHIAVSLWLGYRWIF